MHYSLLIVDQQKTIPLPSARNQPEALGLLSKEVGQRLTLEGDGPAPFLLDQWEQGPRWLNHQIPVYIIK